MSLWIRAGMLVLVLSLGATTSWAAYKGQVVDADTKEPIEGVVVFMEWNYLEFSLMPHSHKFVAAYDTLTDKEGRFSLQRWWSLNPWRLMFADNLLTIFKSGYEPVGGGSWWTLLEYEWGADKGTFIWKLEDGNPVILLKKVTDVEQRKRNMSRIHRGPTKNDFLTKEINKERQFFGFEPLSTE